MRPYIGKQRYFQEGILEMMTVKTVMDLHQRIWYVKVGNKKCHALCGAFMLRAQIYPVRTKLPTKTLKNLRKPKFSVF